MKATGNMEVSKDFDVRISCATRIVPKQGEHLRCADLK